MDKVVARIKLKNKHFEIHVNLDEALKVKSGKGDIMSALDSNKIFTDLKKGNVASQADLKECFNTLDLYEIAKIIITKGEVQKTQEFRDTEREGRINQIVTLIVKNSSDQHGRPYTEDRIRRALQEAHVNIDNKPAEQQLPGIIEKLKTILPIKLEVKRIKLIIPAQYTGQIYGLLKDYKESEDWLSNGNLEAVINIPAGMQIDFYDKLNNITHGAVQSQDLPNKA
jgi:ribosome maturation protein SDO1